MTTTHPICETCNKEKYLVQRVPSGYLGNSPVFWAKGDKGYTPYILAAKIWDKNEALELVARDNKKWRIWPLSDIVRRTRLVVDLQDFPLRDIDQSRNSHWDIYLPEKIASELLGNGKNNT